MLYFRFPYLSLAYNGLAFLLLVVLLTHMPERPAPRHQAQDPAYSWTLPQHVSMPAFPQWTAVMARDWARDSEWDLQCSNNIGRPCHLNAWERFLTALKDRSPRMQLVQVNRYINRIQYVSDQKAWGTRDYWAGPGEFFANGGDCEDFAIAKYFSLRALGFAPEDMRLVVLNDSDRDLVHAVLVVDWQGQEIVLDNLNDRIRSWDEVANYHAVYSINEYAYYLHRGRDIAVHTTSAAGNLLPASLSWLADDDQP
jgi:predicted transglutaminase-like cysteine proteinase